MPMLRWLDDDKARGNLTRRMGTVPTSLIWD